jgi:nitrile hydratase accessory protein
VSTSLERPFDAPWQARAFALTVNLHERGLFTWDEWATALGAAVAEDPERAYYESWLEALQAMVTSSGTLEPHEIADTHQAWLDAAARTPHGKPIELDANRGIEV